MFAFSNYHSDSQPTSWGASWCAVVKLVFWIRTELGRLWPLTLFYNSICSISLTSHIMYSTNKSEDRAMGVNVSALTCLRLWTLHSSHWQCLLSFQSSHNTPLPHPTPPIFLSSCLSLTSLSFSVYRGNSTINHLTLMVNSYLR